jgi:alpha-tubulin suppressor-like RCC1 family protein
MERVSLNETAVNEDDFLDLDGRVWACRSGAFKRRCLASAICLFLFGSGELLARSTTFQLIPWGGGSSAQYEIPEEATNVAAFALGNFHNVILQSNGTVVAWGANWYGQCYVPFGLTNVTAIAAGGYHTLAVKSGGTVVAWGAGMTNSPFDHDYGQSVVPEGLASVKAVAAGECHSVALKSDGTIVAWGRNSDGQTNVPWGLTNVTAIASGDDFNLALKADGTIAAWGSDSFGRTKVPSGLADVRAVAVGEYHCLALRADGSVVAWGDSQSVVPEGLAGVKAIAAGLDHSVALRSNGTVIAWGGNYSGETNVPWGLTNVTAIASSGRFNLALTDASPIFTEAPGRLFSAYSGESLTLRLAAAGLPPLQYQWQIAGTNIAGATDSGLLFSNVELTDAGEYTLVVSNPYGAVSGAVKLTVRDSGPIISTQPKSQVVGTGWDTPLSVWATGSAPLYYQWRYNGDNLPGATRALLQLTNLQVRQSGTYDVVVSNAFGSILSSNVLLSVLASEVVAWGDNSCGQRRVPPGLTNVAAISAGDTHVLVLKRDGTVVAWGGEDSNGNYDCGQTNVPSGLSNVMAVAAGGTHSLALRRDGTVVAWGGCWPQLRAVPADLTNAIAISAGYYDSCALREDGRVVSWGIQPHAVAGLSNVVEVVPGLALTRDGTVVQSYSDREVRLDLSNVVAIAVGYSHVVALKANGTITNWGWNYNKAVAQPVGLSNVIAIAAGGEYSGVHSLALRHDGTVFAWGNNDSGQTNVPAGLSEVVAVAAGARFSLALVNPNPPAANIAGVNKHGDSFSLTIPTVNGRVYVLESTPTLSADQWAAAPLVAGNGAFRVLTDPNSVGTQRFYRVRQW